MAYFQPHYHVKISNVIYIEVRREYLDDIYNDITKNYGGIEDYLCQACHVEQNRLQNLKDLLLE
ncbi:tyrosine-protein phosphatase [Aneurinibacillus migulanus]|uniref:tyrosine-protein phosphatase n=1 Tax=Aneurinibacillus migulanus TaxID=47500 RepID=UPI00399CBC5A